jgi:hypothetical protein
MRATGNAISPRGDMLKNRVLILQIIKGAACHTPLFHPIDFLAS